jgi:hypothetical protein
LLTYSTYSVYLAIRVTVIEVECSKHNQILPLKSRYAICDWLKKKHCIFLYVNFFSALSCEFGLEIILFQTTLNTYAQSKRYNTEVLFSFFLFFFFFRYILEFYNFWFDGKWNKVSVKHTRYIYWTIRDNPEIQSKQWFTPFHMKKAYRKMCVIFQTGKDIAHVVEITISSSHIVMVKKNK